MTTAHPAACACPTTAFATNPASINASTAAQLNRPYYPAGSALVLTAINAANASITLNRRHESFSQFAIPQTCNLQLSSF
jgi:hypothetical protein